MRLNSLGNEDDKRYASLQLGCYALDAYHNGQWYTFNAIATINDPGRYINHASRGNNLTLMKPVNIDGQLNRVRLMCPIKGCTSQQLKRDGFVKLSKHLMEYHHVKEKAQRKKLCGDARQVCIP